MQLQFLRTLKIETAIRKRLGQLPASLREAYNDTYEIRLESYVEEQKSITISAFKLLLSLQTPLDHEEFRHALSFCSEDVISLSNDELIDLCCGFLTLDIEQNVYRFAHLSVREYLETKSEYGPERSHALAAQVCLRYLCTRNDSGPFLIPRDARPDSGVVLADKDVSSICPRNDGRVKSCTTNPSVTDQPDKYPFVDRVQQYVCLYWANHAAQSQHLLLVHPLNTMLQKFILHGPQDVSPRYIYWNKLAIHMSNHYVSGCLPRMANAPPKKYDIREMISNVTNSAADYFFTASLWGFHDLLEIRLNSKPDLSLLRSQKGYNALQFACRYGNHDTVKLLLDRGWELRVESKFSLLVLAIDGLRHLIEHPWRPCLDMEDHIKTVRLLLSHSVNPRYGSDFTNGEHSGYDKLIRNAIEVGSAELVKLLLDYGATAGVRDDMRLSAFHMAKSKGKHEIADLLLAAGMGMDNFDRIMSKTETALIQALRDNSATEPETALRDWSQDARGSKYLDAALRTAVLNKKRNAYWVKDLLDKGANPNAKFCGFSLLDEISRSYSEKYGKYTMDAVDWPKVQLLIENGADPEGKKYMEVPPRGRPRS